MPMEGDVAAKLLTLGALLGLSAFFSGSESAFFSLGPLRIQRLREKSQRAFQASAKLLEEPTRLLSTLLIGNEIVNTSIGVVGAALIYDVFRPRLEDSHWLPVLAIALVSPFLLIFGEMVPKAMGIKYAEKCAGTVALPLWWFSLLVRPIRGVVLWLPRQLLRFLGVSEKGTSAVSEELFRSMVDLGTQEGVLDPQEQKLIHNVFHLDDVAVSALMTPREKISSLSDPMTVGEALRHFERERYSRYPVFSSQTGELAGILYVKDLLAPQGLDENKPIHSFLREPFLVSKDTKALELFAQLRAQRTHIALVREGTSSEILGLITLEDVLEEVFGDIRDEQDVEEDLPWKPS